MKLKTFLCTAAFCAAAFLSAAPFCQVNRIPAGSKNIPWERAVEISGFSKVITLDHAAEQTALYLLHDGIFLYGKVVCAQKDKTSGSKVRDDLMIWKNNTAELFFSDVKGDIRHVIINSEGTVTDFLHRLQAGGAKKTDRSWSPVVITRSGKSKGFWHVEFKIPLKELSFDTSGSSRFNVVRNNYCRKEFSSWTPLEKHVWFQPEKFGQITLSPKEAGQCSVTWQKFPVPRPGDSVKLTVNASSPCKAVVEIVCGKLRTVRSVVLKKGANVFNFPYKAGGSRKCTATITAGKKVIYIQEDMPREDFIEVYGRRSYFISAVREMPTAIFWQQLHTLPGGNMKRGGMVKVDYEILFDLPEGIVVQGAEKVGPSPRGKGRYVASSKQKNAYAASNWLKSFIMAEKSSVAPGKIYYRVKWGKFLQPEREFDFKVYSFAPAKPLKLIPVSFYNFFPRSVADAEQVRRFGINTLLIRGFDVKLTQSFREAGFFLVRGGYFWPGGDSAGYYKWPKWDRSARALDVNGNTVYGKDGPQFSPSYRGKYFLEAVKKERAFAHATGITHYSFDMEGYIMPNAELACFRPESLARFKEWFGRKYPGKKYVSPKVFEKEPGKYPELHRIWVEFKDHLFASFFLDFKRMMGKIPGKGSVPWPGLTISEWSFSIPEKLEDIHSTMRGKEFIKAFSWFERSAYSSAERNIRELLYQREKIKKYLPGFKVNMITCPSPERLDLDLKPGETGYYTSPAPKLEDELKYKIFDSIAFGCRGISIWYYPAMTARAWKNLTEAIRAVGKVEHIVPEGKEITGLKCTQTLGYLPQLLIHNRTLLKNQPRIIAHGIRKGKEALIAVSEYREAKKTVTQVTCPVKSRAVVTDVESGEKIAVITPEKPVFSVTLDRRRCRLLLVKEL